MDSTATESDVLENVLLDPSAQPIFVPLYYLKKITRDFCTELELGRGGYGVVYKGVLPGGLAVAVKKLFGLHLPADHDQFRKEITFLMGIKHQNVVQLRGYCVESRWEMEKLSNGDYVLAEIPASLLCFEYLCNNSLDKHISDESSGLTWKTRYEIIKGICCGLHFLHKECSIVHLDLKPQNILMDSSMKPKIADFGLSRLLGKEKSRIITINFAGTFGYMAPEYITQGIITPKADIFSLGVIMIEIITGRREYPKRTVPYFQHFHDNNSSQRNTETCFQQFTDKVRCLEVGETGLKQRRSIQHWKRTDAQQVEQCLTIALQCVDPDLKKRPNALDIIQILNTTERSCCAKYGKDSRLGHQEEIPPEMHCQDGLAVVLNTSIRKDIRIESVDEDRLNKEATGHALDTVKSLVADGALSQPQYTCEESLLSTLQVELGAGDRNYHEVANVFIAYNGPEGTTTEMSRGQEGKLHGLQPQQLNLTSNTGKLVASRLTKCAFGAQACCANSNSLHLQEIWSLFSVGSKFGCASKNIGQTKKNYGKFEQGSVSQWGRSKFGFGQKSKAIFLNKNLKFPGFWHDQNVSWGPRDTKQAVLEVPKTHFIELLLNTVPPKAATMRKQPPNSDEFLTLASHRPTVTNSVGHESIWNSGTHQDDVLDGCSFMEAKEYGRVVHQGNLPAHIEFPLHQGWRRLVSQKHMVNSSREWPLPAVSQAWMGGFMARGVLASLGPMSVFAVLWSCFMCITSLVCPLFALLTLGAARTVIHYMGYMPGLLILGLFGMVIMSVYGYFWVTGMIMVAGGSMCFLRHAQYVLPGLTAYAIYCVAVRVGWLGVFLTFNLSFLTNDLLNKLLQGHEGSTEEEQFEDMNDSDPVMDEFYRSCEIPPAPDSEPETVSSAKRYCSSPSNQDVLHVQKEEYPNQIMKSDSSSLYEIKRIMDSSNHYEVLGVPHNRSIDQKTLKKEYHRMVRLVHPDKNMGNPLACESFKKLTSAYEVLSDFTKKYSYDEQLRKEDPQKMTQRSRVVFKQVVVFQQNEADVLSEESRRIQCTKCSNFHIWICTKRSKTKARFCQGCDQYHQAKDGDGWVETRFSASYKMEIPRAFVCAESKIFDVSEWATWQGMECIPNTHGPTFMVNMVGADGIPQKTIPEDDPSLDAEKIPEDEFELWLQQELASGVFADSPKRKKSWSPFKLPQKGIQSWRRSS